MGIVRTIIWVLLTAILVIFAMANWKVVTVTIWPGWEAETKLPVIILVTFLIGSIPMWVALRTQRWSMRRRRDASERQRSDLRATTNRPAEPAPKPAPPVNDIPPSPLETQ